MFRKRTLFVVGAGASAEVGLPVGTELAKIIGNKLDIRFDDFGQRHIGSGDKDLFGQFHQQYRDEINEYQKACWLIRDGILLSNSIDDFLDVHGNNERVRRVGKASIVKAILEAERSSTLYFDTTNPHNKLNLGPIADTWFTKLMRMLGRGLPLEQVELVFDNIAFIVFNYDRCIEHFLFYALRQLYSISDQRAAEIMGKLRIIHPYGTIGGLPFMDSAPISFGGGGERLREPYLALSDRIRTYTEQIKDASEVEEIREQVSTAGSIVFLGFAFHDQNLDLLRPKTSQAARNIWGTAYGMSDSDIAVIQQQLLSFLAPDISRMIDRFASLRLDTKHKCSDIFDYYTKSLPA